MLRLIVVLVALVGSATTEVTISKPTPPTAPTIEGAVTLPTSTQTDTLTARFTRLDSIQGIRAQVEARLREIREIEKELEAGLPPTSRRPQTYPQEDVDSRAKPIRRSLPTLSSNIEIQFVITPEGKTRDIRVLSASSDETALIVESVAHWRYVPALRRGRRVPSSVTTTIRVTDK